MSNILQQSLSRPILNIKTEITLLKRKNTFLHVADFWLRILGSYYAHKHCEDWNQLYILVQWEKQGAGDCLWEMR